MWIPACQCSISPSSRHRTVRHFGWGSSWRRGSPGCCHKCTIRYLFKNEKRKRFDLSYPNIFGASTNEETKIAHFFNTLGAGEPFAFMVIMIIVLDCKQIWIYSDNNASTFNPLGYLSSIFAFKGEINVIFWDYELQDFTLVREQQKRPLPTREGGLPSLCSLLISWNFLFWIKHTFSQHVP